MKRFLLIIFACIFISSAMIFNVSAEVSEYSDESSSGGEFVFSDDIFLEESSVIIFEEHPNKKLEWAYWIIGIGAIGLVVASAVVISKKRP